MKGQIPYGFKDAVEANEHGWVVWKKDHGCPTCEKKEDEDGELLNAFTCPECGSPGCDDCMPSGRGCVCPTCEEESYDEEDDDDEW